MSKTYVGMRPICHYQTKYVSCETPVHVLPINNGEIVCKKHLEDKMYDLFPNKTAVEYLDKYYEELANREAEQAAKEEEHSTNKDSETDVV